MIVLVLGFYPLIALDGVGARSVPRVVGYLAQEAVLPILRMVEPCSGWAEDSLQGSH